tara:strand:- start:1409 stop:1591 length:183 start_codon:yes stop_codon:yes gene_type:complete
MNPAERGVFCGFFSSVTFRAPPPARRLKRMKRAALPDPRAATLDPVLIGPDPRPSIREPR